MHGVHHATLTYVFDGDEVLLIQKKTGHGAGLVNAPGGKLEDGEGPHAASRRETREEVGVEPVGQEKVGELRFVFGDEPFMHVHVFVADDHEGEPRESDEADPVWMDARDLPYDEMWEDDRYWMPLMLDGARFHATFRFDSEGDEMAGFEVERGHHRHPAGSSRR